MVDHRVKSNRSRNYRIFGGNYWFLKYKWKESLSGDLMAGITMAIIQIPQGMAYGLLANVPPVLGIYTSIFPVLIYSMFGPSSHVSKGTNALMCMITGSFVQEYLVRQKNSEVSEHYSSLDTSISTDTTTNMFSTNSDIIFKSASDKSFQFPPLVEDTSNVTSVSNHQVHDKIAYATSLCLATGMWQVILSAMKFGKLSWVMSEIVLSAFVTAAAFHILTSQMKSLFGIIIQRSPKLFGIIYTYSKLVNELPNTNMLTFLLGISSLGILILYDQVIKDRIKEKCSFPIPIHLIVVIVGTALSHVLHFESKFGVDVVGQIPKGLPFPVIPPVNYVMSFTFLLDSFVLAVLGFCISLSMGKPIASMFNYDLDATSELSAEGISNIVGSFFKSVPSTASMSRSMVQIKVNCKTQLTGIISALLLAIILLSISSVFESLPKAILSAIVLSCLSGMFLHIKDFQRFYSKSKVDGILWMGTFLCVLLTSADIGLGIGIILTVFVMAYRNYQVTITPLDIRDEQVVCDDSISGSNDDSLAKIQTLRLSGTLSFANCDSIISRCKSLFYLTEEEMSAYKILILDLTRIHYIDQIAAKAFVSWAEPKEGKGHNVEYFKAPLIYVIVAPDGGSRKMLIAHNWRNHHHMFKSMKDAYHYAKIAIKDTNIDTKIDLGKDLDADISKEESKKNGFQSIFEKRVNNFGYHLLASDESAASGSKSDTDIET